MNKMIIDITVLSDEERQLLIGCLPTLILLEQKGMIKHSTSNLILQDISDYVYLKTINRKDDKNGNS